MISKVSGPVVAICVPIYNRPTTQFWRSLNQLQIPHLRSQIFGEGTTYKFDMHGYLIDHARTALTDDALRAHEAGGPPVTHVLFIDDDMSFPPHALAQLIAHRVPIVGGLCHNRRLPYNPILARKHPSSRGLDNKIGWVYHFPPNGLVEVDATGGAFLLIERKVFEAVDEKFGKARWWTTLNNMSEDFSFCARAQECGFKILVDVGLDIGHVAEVVVDKAFAQKNRPFEVNSWVDELETPEGQPAATVVIPTYNQVPKFLKAAVLSASHQTRPVEVIVVDDGSDPPVPFEGWPENVQVVRHAVDGEDVRCLLTGPTGEGRYHPQNRGIAEALNTGLRCMKTDWFCWLSSDDLMDPRKVERQLQILRSVGGKAGFHRYQSYVGDETAEPYPRIAQMVAWKSVEEQRTILSKACTINGSTIMVHREAIEDVGWFDPNFRYGQDWEWFCRVGEKYFWYPIDEILGTRREYGNLTETLEKSTENDPRRLRRDAEDSSIRERYRWPK